MTEAGVPAGRVAWKVVGTYVSLVVVIGALTILFLGMRAVMEIGGSCASGGAYAIATPCPKGVGWMVPVSIWVGIIALGFYIGCRSGLPGPQWWTLAWPALFLSLGWNFWEFGLASGAIEWSAVICGIVFVLMGGAPLIAMLSSPDTRRELVWGDPDPVAERPSTRDVVKSAVPSFKGVRRQGAVVAPRDLPLTGTGTDDMAEDLETLAELHEEGHLSEAEYRHAKKRRIGETP